MASDNQTAIVGNLVDDPELRFTNNGTPVANLPTGPARVGGRRLADRMGGGTPAAAAGRRQTGAAQRRGRPPAARAGRPSAEVRDTAGALLLDPTTSPAPGRVGQPAASQARLPGQEPADPCDDVAIGMAGADDGLLVRRLHMSAY
jgi:hypothetical protein